MNKSRKSKYLNFGISIKFVPRIAQYQKRRFADNENIFNKLPFGTQMNMTLEALLDDADLLQTLEKGKKDSNS